MACPELWSPVTAQLRTRAIKDERLHFLFPRSVFSISTKILVSQVSKSRNINLLVFIENHKKTELLFGGFEENVNHLTI